MPIQLTLSSRTCVRQVENCGNMTIELTTPAAARALADYLELCGCTVDFASDRALEVALPTPAQSGRAALIEMHAYLQVWRAMHPGHEVEIVEEA